MMKENQKLSVLEKTSYGVGDLACNLFWGLICMATVFYTDYFGLDAGVAGTMILIVSCLDIAFDVIIGAVADRRVAKYWQGSIYGNSNHKHLHSQQCH